MHTAPLFRSPDVCSICCSSSIRQSGGGECKYTMHTQCRMFRFFLSSALNGGADQKRPPSPRRQGIHFPGEKKALFCRTQQEQEQTLFNDLRQKTTRGKKRCFVWINLIFHGFKLKRDPRTLFATKHVFSRYDFTMKRDTPLISLI